jgi:flagellar basal body-associated protein FliL
VARSSNPGQANSILTIVLIVLGILVVAGVGAYFARIEYYKHRAR